MEFKKGKVFTFRVAGGRFLKNSLWLKEMIGAWKFSHEECLAPCNDEAALISPESKKIYYHDSKST
jgi:hypothetical protein